MEGILGVTTEDVHCMSNVYLGRLFDDAQSKTVVLCSEKDYYSTRIVFANSVLQLESFESVRDVYLSLRGAEKSRNTAAIERIAMAKLAAKRNASSLVCTLL